MSFFFPGPHLGYCSTCSYVFYFAPSWLRVSWFYRLGGVISSFWGVPARYVPDAFLMICLGYRYLQGRRFWRKGLLLMDTVPCGIIPPLGARPLDSRCCPLNTLFWEICNGIRHHWVKDPQKNPLFSLHDEHFSINVPLPYKACHKLFCWIDHQKSNLKTNFVSGSHFKEDSDKSKTITYLKKCEWGHVFKDVGISENFSEH